MKTPFYIVTFIYIVTLVSLISKNQNRWSNDNNTALSFQELDKYNNVRMLYNNIQTREQKNTPLEFATILKAYEWGIEQRKRFELLFLTKIVLVSLMVLLACNIQHRNISVLTKKQKLLSHKEKYHATDKKNIILLTDTNITKEEKAVGQSITNTAIDEDARLFEKLEYILTKEKLFLDPNLSREKLMKLIHVNKNRFGKILQQYAGTNTSTYINDKRLKYACKLLNETPQYTIAAIGELCGIPNPSTFNRLFRCKFGMTPSEFKNKSKSLNYKQDTSEDGQNNAHL